MQISHLRISNFRCIKRLEVELGETTVFIGANNAGKSAIVEAVRIVLTRRWGQRGTGFTENDIYRPDDKSDPKTLPPVQIEIVLEELRAGQWDPDMVADLEDVIALLPDGRNVLTLRVTCAWNEEKEDFIPAWEFLDANGTPLTGGARRAMNFSNFFKYLPLFWLDALRDAAKEFTPRSEYWGQLLRRLRIPATLQSEATETLKALDEKIIAADPRLTELAEMIGQATHVSICDSPGDAKLNTLPLTMEEMLKRAGIMLCNEKLRPWLPLDHHGQGLQSLSVVYLFQAAALLQLRESGHPGTEAVFALEEPEVHLHPQAARTLWDRLQVLPGQKLLTTHSQYFLQHVPLHDLRLVRLVDGCTQTSSLLRQITSSLPWNAKVEQLSKHEGSGVFVKTSTDHVATIGSFSEIIGEKLEDCFKGTSDATRITETVTQLRHDSRLLISTNDEEALGFLGRRLRGEIFFARQWILVEGVCEYMLMHALGKAFDWPLDAHGVAMIDFQQGGSPGVYISLAESLSIPWHGVMDGDAQSAGFRREILNRGFDDSDLTGKLVTLPSPNDLEDQLIADGHEQLLRELLAESCGTIAMTCSADEFKKRLKNRKTNYMSKLAIRVATQPDLAARMPASFVRLIQDLKGGTI